MHSVWQRKLGLRLLILALMVGLAVVLSSTVTAQGPTGDVPYTQPEQLRVPQDKGGTDATQQQKDAETECYPCTYWVTGIRVQKLSYPLYQPLAGWQFTIFDAANNQVAQDVTGPNGTVDFFNLPPGTYRVVETAQTNWQPYYPQSGTVTVPVYGGYVTFFRFYNQQGGIVPPPPPPPPPTTQPQVGSLTVCKLDVTTAPAGTAVPNWPFVVTRGPQVVGSFTTEANGCRTIAQLPAGQYRVEEAMLPGWDFVSVEPPANPAGTRGTVVNVVAGPTAASVTFRNKQVSTPQTVGAVRACKLDVTTAAQGTAVPGWFISLQVAAPGGGTRYGYTGYDGCVTFPNLPPGAYTVTEAQRNGWQFVSADPAPAPGQSYATTVTVAAGATTNVAFRNQRIVPASIRVCKFDATTATDVPLNGWQMVLRREAAGPVIASAWTGTFYSGPGCVTFGNLVPGTYVVEEAAYPGWTLVSVAPDEDGNATNLQARITLTNGQNATVNFRNRRATAP